MFLKLNKDNPVIAWWSGGIASAVTCWLCIKWFGLDNIRLVFINTRNEDDDTYRFLSDCEEWLGCKIEIIASDKYKCIQDVWYSHLSLNTATGAICSTVLKRLVREKWQETNKYSHQAFGYDINEIDRAQALRINHPDCRPIYPLIYELLDKKRCFNYLPIGLFKIEPPQTYRMGYVNNNCFKTGCVQGGIGYWQKIMREDKSKFDAMAKVEHEITDQRGSPITMLKDQSKNGGLVFLKPHPNYPDIKDISMMKGREPVTIFECNGFCGINDLIRNESEAEINLHNS